MLKDIKIVSFAKNSSLTRRSEMCTTLSTVFLWSFFVTGDVKLLLENLPKKKLQVSFRHHEPSLYAGSLAEFSYMREIISPHIDARRTTNICALLLLLFLAVYPPLAGLNLLAQLSDRIHNFHFTALNSVHVRNLGY